MIPPRGNGTVTPQAIAEWEVQRFSVLRVRSEFVTVVDDAPPDEPLALLLGKPEQREELRQVLGPL